MKIVNLTQGSAEWHDHRAEHFNASDAPAMFGTGKFETRSELIHRLATGETKEVSPELQRRFDDGHATEAQARPIVEELIGEELFPIVGVSDEHPRLSASFDGITADRETGFEHKRWNEDLAEQVRTGAIADNQAYWPQLEQQILVGGLQRVIFTVSDGTPERMETYTYTPRAGRAEQVIAGWAQLEKDLAAYIPKVAKAAVVAAPVQTLPAILYTVNRTDLTVTHNLPEFKAAAAALIESTKAPLVTDQDFADRDAICKVFRDAEKRLKMRAEEAIGEIKDVAALARELNDLSEQFRVAAIASEKMIDAEKANRKNAILAAGKQAMAEHMQSLNERFKGRAIVVPALVVDLAAAAKNKRTLASVQDAVDTAVAQAKIMANATADGIAANLASLDMLAADYIFLFADLQQLIGKPNGDFCLLAKDRIGQHKAKEAARLQAETERIERETRERLESEAREEARRLAERQEAEAAERAETARREEEQREAQQEPAKVIAPTLQETAANVEAATDGALTVVSAPAPQVTTATQAKTGGMAAYAALRRQARPSANDIINLVATTWQTSPDEARQWLVEEFSESTQTEAVGG